MLLKQVNTVRFMNYGIMALEIQDCYGNTILIRVAADFDMAGLNGHCMRKVTLVCKGLQQGKLGPARSASVTEKWQVR